MRIGEDQKKDCIRLLRESPPSLVSKLHENKGNRANKHDHKIWAIKSIFCEINNSAGKAELGFWTCSGSHQRKEDLISYNYRLPWIITIKNNIAEQ